MGVMMIDQFTTASISQHFATYVTPPWTSGTDARLPTLALTMQGYAHYLGRQFAAVGENQNGEIQPCADITLQIALCYRR